VDAALDYVRNRQPTEDQTGPADLAPLTASMSHTAILRRMDEDRERHKRLREKRWVQPTSVHMMSSSLASSLPDDVEDLEFEDAWETTSDWNEDDIEAVAEEDNTCFPTFRES
jgi:CTD kinase subunit gamma